MADLACGHEKWDTPWNGKRRQKMRNTQLHIAIEAMVFKFDLGPRSNAHTYSNPGGGGIASQPALGLPAEIRALRLRVEVMR